MAVAPRSTTSLSLSTETSLSTDSTTKDCAFDDDLAELDVVLAVEARWMSCQTESTLARCCNRRASAPLAIVMFAWGPFVETLVRWGVEGEFGLDFTLALCLSTA